MKRILFQKYLLILHIIKNYNISLSLISYVWSNKIDSSNNEL